MMKEYLDPEKFRDPRFDSKKDFSSNHQEMERLQKILGPIRKEMELKRELAQNLEIKISQMKKDPSISGDLEKMENMLSGLQEEIPKLQKEVDRLVAEIADLFATHLEENKLLDAVGEGKSSEN